MVDGIVEHCSFPIVLALFDRIDDRIPFSNSTLPFLARKFNEIIIAIFLDRHGSNSLINEEVLAAAASNGEHGPDVVTILLQRSHVLPTESVLLAAATNLGQGLNVFNILLAHLSETSGNIVDTDRKNDAVALEGLLAKDVLFAGLETCFADTVTKYRSQKIYFTGVTLQDRVLRVVAMLIECGVSVVFNEDDLLRLFELYTLGPHSHFILQTHRGRLPAFTPNLIARVRLRVTKYLSYKVFRYDPLFVPAIHLAIRDIDPITFNSLIKRSERPSQEVSAVVESCSQQWLGKQTVLQVLNSQELEITGEMIIKGALDQFDSFELLRQPNLGPVGPESKSEIVDEETWIFMVWKFTDLDLSRLDPSLVDWKEVIEKAGRRGMISESVLSSVIRTKNYDMVDLCLKNYHKPLVVTQQLVDSFAGFPPRFHLEPRARPDVKSLRRLLQHGTLVHPIHSSSIERILEIFGSGIADELFKITENRLLVDESVLVSIVSTKNVKIIKSFFKRYTDHLTITPRVLIMVLQTDAPSHVEVTTNDEYGEPDETSECNPGWPESDELYDSKSSDHSSVLKPRQYWYAEPQVPNDERDAENLKMNEDTNTAYYTSAYLLEYLLRYCTYDPMGLTKDILLSAVANRECEALFTIIAKYYSLESVRITQNIAQAAASNSKRNVQLLLDWFPGKVPITEDVLIAAARNSKESYETLRLLFSCSSYRISVSKKVMIALLQNPNSCPSAFRLVFEYGGSSLLRSQEIKTSIVRNAGRGSVLQFFLELPGFSLTVTENMVRSNENDGEPLISSILLFKDRRVRFSPASIAFVMAKGDADSTMSLLEKLATDREDHHLTENVFLHAISNEQERAWFTVHHLLPLISKFLTEKAWIAAAKNKVNGWTLMQMFADYDPTLESMTPTVLLHAARNDLLGNDILKWLLSYHPSKVRFSEGILAAISGNPSWWTGEPLTSEIYRPHIWQNGPILEVILHQAQENAKITENILIAAVKNPTHSARYLRVLLQHPTREVLNLQRVAAIAAAQESVEIKSLLSFFQHGARTNEDIVVAAMRNSQRGGDIFELLRVENLWGDFVATDKVLSAAADNAENGNDLLEDFLRSYQGVIVLQDEHIEKVANSFSLDVMRQLRIRQRFPVSNPLPVFAYSHYLFYVLHRWFVLYC